MPACDPADCAAGRGHGMALNQAFTQVVKLDLTLFTVIVGHATFCIVVVLQQRRGARCGEPLAISRRRAPTSGRAPGRRRGECSNQLRSAMVAAALLAFGAELGAR